MSTVGETGLSPVGSVVSRGRARAVRTRRGGSMIVKAGRTPRILPYPMEDIERTSDGVLRYTKLLPSLVHLLRATVEAGPDTEALVELGGERLTYQQLWDRASRVAGGLRALGIGRGDRVGIHLPNGNDWALAFFGIQMLGAVA